MRLTVLGGSGAWPEPGLPCSGYLVETTPHAPEDPAARGTQDAPKRILVDPGYATVGQLLKYTLATDVDAVFVSHGHPDHCADLNPLLRARALSDTECRALPIFAPPGAVDVVLALDDPEMMDDAYELHEFTVGESFNIGPLHAETRSLPHFVPNAGLRLSDGRHSVTYTGDCGPTDALPELAEASDLLLAEATYVDDLPDRHLGNLSTARDVGKQARLAGVGKLMLTHLRPGTDPKEALRAAEEEYGGPSLVARPDRVVKLA